MSADLLARLEQARASLPDPGDVPAPNARRRVMERRALLDRYHSGIAGRQRRVDELEGLLLDAQGLRAGWREIEGALRGRLDAARDELAEASDLREQRRLAGIVRHLEMQVGWADPETAEMIPVECGMTVISDPIASLFEAAFGRDSDRAGEWPTPQFVAGRIELLEREVKDARQRLASELASLEVALREEVVAA